jgi:lysozyme family protein
MNTLLSPTEEHFKQYVKHVLSWEGLTSKDPADTAASCSPFAGAYHTNRGVTFCTFKKVAPKIGVTPVSYDRFTKLTDEDVAKFIFYFCQQADADELPTLVALSVTEAAWGSGPHKAIEQLQEALINLGCDLKADGDFGSKTRAAVASVNDKELYSEFWAVRQNFIERLLAQAKYKTFKNGWHNRIQGFFKIFGKP